MVLGHATVGHIFKTPGGGTALVTHYLKRTGFILRQIIADKDMGRRKADDVYDISERAVGRTFHRVSWNDASEAAAAAHVHPTNCECYICCEKRDV